MLLSVVRPSPSHRMICQLKHRSGGWVGNPASTSLLGSPTRIPHLEVSSLKLCLFQALEAVWDDSMPTHVSQFEGPEGSVQFEIDLAKVISRH